MCVEEGCGEANHSRGLCKMHYQRLLRSQGGRMTQPRKSGVKPTRPLVRLLRFVKLGQRCPRMKTRCWEWTGSRSAGYGMISMKPGPPMQAHIVAYLSLVGLIPDGLELDHLCKNKGCCNPRHLEPVTHAENLRRAYEDHRKEVA